MRLLSRPCTLLYKSVIALWTLQIKSKKSLFLSLNLSLSQLLLFNFFLFYFLFLSLSLRSYYPIFSIKTNGAAKVEYKLTLGSGLT